MRIIIGLALIILGTFTSVLFPNGLSYTLIFVGTFLFASFSDESVFVDYVIANGNEALARKRHYFEFLPFTMVLSIFTFGKVSLKILWKEEYFRVSTQPDDSEPVKINRKEYILLRNEQRRIYSDEPLSKEFMEKSYNLEDIGFKRKKIRLIIVSIVVVLLLTGLTDPGGYIIMLIYEAIFLPMLILWIPEYKDAKILHNAYNRAMGETSGKD